MKLFRIILSLVLFITLLAGCGSQAQLPSANELAEALKGFSSSSVNWVELDKTKTNSYFGFTDENLLAFKGYINDSEEHFDIVAVFKLEDMGKKKEIYDGIAQLTSNAGANYRIASENEYNKINGHVIAEKEDFIILCIMDNYERIKKYLTEEIGAEIMN